MSTRSRGHEELHTEHAAWARAAQGPDASSAERGVSARPAPAVWYERCEARPVLPFAGYFADPSENPTVRPQPAPPRRDHEPVALEDGLVVIARRRRP